MEGGALEAEALLAGAERAEVLSEVWLDRTERDVSDATRSASDRIFWVCGKVGRVERWFVGRRFLTSADTARKKCGRDEGEWRDGRPIWSTGRTGGLAGVTSARSCGLGRDADGVSSVSARGSTLRDRAGGLSRRVGSVRRLPIGGRYFSRRSDAYRRHGAREAEWFGGKLTVISMRPAGWPPMDMSKKQTGLDIVIVEFACGSDQSTCRRSLFTKVPSAGKTGKKGETDRRPRVFDALRQHALRHIRGTPTAREGARGIQRHPEPERRSRAAAASTMAAGELSRLLDQDGDGAIGDEAAERMERAEIARAQADPTPRRASAGCRSPGSSSPSTRSRKRRRRRGWVR